ncbi:MAG: phage tail protein [Allosphingosinicella sp.]
MGTPFMGELRLVSFNLAPQGWAFANGQLLPINQNQALFALLGTTYGGNGQTNFALPDLRGRVPIHRGSTFTQGQKVGEEAHTLTLQEMPTHIHFQQAVTDNGDIDLASGANLASFNNGYRGFSNAQALAPSAVSNVGGSQAHNNMQPYTVLNVIIALQGIFPSHN